MGVVERAVVVYDCDQDRAAAVAIALRTLDLEPLLIDHAALMRTMIQSPASRQALLIGDVADAPDWRELGHALRGYLSDVRVIAYGTSVCRRPGDCSRRQQPRNPLAISIQERGVGCRVTWSCYQPRCPL